MGPHDYFLFTFLAFFAAEFLIERVLAVLNAQRVRSFRGRMPAELHGLVTPETFERSIDYTLARIRFGHAAAIYGALVTLAVLMSGFLIPTFSMAGHIFREADTSGWINDYGAGAIALLLLGATLALLNLPVSLYSTFVLERRFGFNKTTLLTFILDRIKGGILAVVLGLPFLWVLMWLVIGTGEFWWLYAALFVIAVQFAMMILGPLLIAPLFNKFTPLEDGDLKRELEALARRCDFTVGGLFVMDGSKRSAHSNAFFTGMGKGRRIVLFDTLIAQLSTSELAAVLAHEIGHYKLKHIPKTLVLSCLLTVAGFFALSLLIDWHPMYQAFRVGTMMPEKGVMIFYLISGSFLFWLAPLFSALSRKHEYEADAYAKARTAAEPMAGALRKLAEKNLSNYVPHPWYSAWHYSHPTLLERLAALRR